MRTSSIQTQIDRDPVSVSSRESNSFTTCICGESLFKIQISNPLISYICDLCFKSCALNDVIYHCVKDQTAEHCNGFDICSKCESLCKSNSISVLSASTLVQYGFELNLSINALRITKCDINMAIKHIFDEQKDLTDIDEFLQSISGTINEPDTKQQEILSILSQRSEQINLSETFDSSRLFTNYHRRTRNNKDEEKCTLRYCDSLQSLTNVLQYHNRMIYNGIYNNMNNEYIQLLNDFDHLLFIHQHEFEDIHRFLLDEINKDVQCPLASCSIMHRNHRDRDKLRDRDDEIKKLYLNISNHKDIAIQQFVDTIHCHFFHSFDIGYKTTKTERRNITEVTELMKLIGSKKRSYANINGLEGLSQQNNDKFKTKVEPIDSNEHNDDDTPYYSFGFRYFYWNHYQNNQNLIDLDIRNDGTFPQTTNGKDRLCDWFIVPRYNNLCEEVVNNGICSISMFQWNNYIFKAKCRLESDSVKKIVSKQISQRLTTKQIYEIEDGSPITCEHLAAMMIYCGQTLLQSAFTATYRRIPFNESDESLKKRHSNYAHFGRLLREIVECFGVSGKGGSDFWRGGLYHGIDKKVMFGAIDTKIKGPTSTTTDFSVAVNYSAHKGMIIELKLDQFWIYGNAFSFPYFDCHWLSDFSNEMEIFFIGGYTKFSLPLIINVPDANNLKLYHYTKALIQLSRLFDGKRSMSDNTPKTKDEMKIIFGLLMHEYTRYYLDDTTYHKMKDIPKYIEILLHNQCQQITTVHITDVDEQATKRKFARQLFKPFFCYDFGFIKLDVITTIYPSLKTICVDLKNKNANYLMLQNEFVYLSTLEYLRQHKDTKLQCIRIIVRDLEKYDQSRQFVDDSVAKYKSAFLTYGWIIRIKEDLGRVISSEPLVILRSFSLYFQSLKSDINFQDIHYSLFSPSDPGDASPNV